MNRIEQQHRSPLRDVLRLSKLLVLLVPALATALALQTTQLLGRVQPEHLHMLVLLLAGCAIVQVAAWLLWRRRMGLGALALGGGFYWAVQLIYYAGPGEVFVSVLLGASALAIGSLLLRQEQYGVLDRLLLGVALMVSVVAWLLPFPLHEPRIYAGVCGLIVLLRWKPLVSDARRVGAEISALGATNPLLVALLVVVVGFASMGLWLPTLNYDDNSGHLAIQSQLLRDGYYRFDIGSQVWALAPWFNNTWHAMAAMLLAEESRVAVNLIWLLLGVTGAYRLSTALGAGSRGGLLAATVFASHPLTTYYGTTLQVDGPSAAVLLHLLSVLCRADLVRRSAWVPGALIGMMLALKMTNVVFLLLPCLYVTWVALRWRRFGWWVGVILVSVLTGGASYVYAAALTGNPTFPMFNTFFQSPYYPLEGFFDPRWHAGIGPAILWDVTFDTSKFMEAYPGALGVSLIALLGGTIVSLVRPGASRWIAIAVLFSGAVLFIEVQYVRYVFPCLVILGVLAVTSLDTLLDRWPGVLIAAVVALCAVNLSLMANTSWIMRGGAWVGLVNEGKQYAAVLVGRVTPHHALLDRMLSRYPQACVLNTDRRPFTARMSGRALSVAWYDPQVSKAVLWSGKDAQGGRWVETIRALGVSHVVVPKQGDPALANALRTLGARWEDQEQELQLWRLDTGSGDNGKCEQRFFDARDNAHRLFHATDTHP